MRRAILILIPCLAVVVLGLGTSMTRISARQVETVNAVVIIDYDAIVDTSSTSLEDIVKHAERLDIRSYKIQEQQMMILKRLERLDHE